MPDYLVLVEHGDDGWRHAGTYLGKAAPEDAVREAYKEPGSYVAIDLAAIEHFDVTPGPPTIAPK